MFFQMFPSLCLRRKDWLLSTNTAIFGLPRVKVHQCRKWLAKDGEGYPKDDIAHYAPGMSPFHFLHWSCNGDERKLQEHAEESDT